MSEPYVDLDGIFAHAVKETEEMLEHGLYLTDPNIITPLEENVIENLLKRLLQDKVIQLLPFHNLYKLL